MIHSLLVMFLLGSTPRAQSPENWTHWAAKVFPETTLCGNPVPRMEALKKEITEKVPGSAPTPEGVAALLRVLDRDFTADPNTLFVGGCHEYSAAIDVAALSELAKGRPEAIELLESLSQKIKPAADGKWHYYLASLHGFETPKGKAHLDRAYELYKQFYADAPGDESDPIYQSVLKLKGIQQPSFTVLTKTADAVCGSGMEFSIAANAVTEQQKDWLKALLDLAHTWCSPSSSFCIAAFGPRTDVAS